MTEKVGTGDYAARRAEGLGRKAAHQRPYRPKIIRRHRITPDEATDAIVGVVGLRHVWSEDDEPVASIVEAFERGQKFETRPPQRGFNRYFDPFWGMAGAHLAAPRGDMRGSGSVHAHPG